MLLDIMLLDIYLLEQALPFFSELFRGVGAETRMVLISWLRSWWLMYRRQSSKYRDALYMVLRATRLVDKIISTPLSYSSLDNRHTTDGVYRIILNAPFHTLTVTAKLYISHSNEITYRDRPLLKYINLQKSGC